jgi:hypothetical protein
LEAVVIGSRVCLASCVLAVAVSIAPAVTFAQYAPSGLSNADLKKLHLLGVPIVAPVPAPRGFKVIRVDANAYDKAYKIVYGNKAGATMVFEGDGIYSSAAQNGAAATEAPTAAPKRGLLQKIFAGSSAKATPAATSAGISGTSSELEGQGKAALVADSQLIGPIRFTPVGTCLQGTADSSKAMLHGLRVIVSACNFSDADALVSAYKSAQRV